MHASAWNLIIKYIGAKTASPPETRATELGSAIIDQFNQIRACDADAWPQILPRLRRLNVLPRPSAPPLRPPSRYFTLYFSLFFSFNLWVSLICYGVWTILFWERESSLSFWTDSFSLSLYNYSIYLSLFFFFFFDSIRWCVTVLVSWCWWVCLLVYCNLWIYLIGSSCVNLIYWVGVDGAMGPCGVGSRVGYLIWGSKGMQRQKCVHTWGVC